MIQPWEMVKVKCPRPEDTNKNLKFVHVFPKIAEVSAGVVLVIRFLRHQNTFINWTTPSCIYEIQTTKRK